MSGSPPHLVVIDTNVLINLMHVSRLGLLAKIPGHRFLVPEQVREELKLSEQQATLDRAIAEGYLKIGVIQECSSLTLFAELTACLGRGEAACLAIAAKKGCMIASDEKRRFLRKVTEHVGAKHVLTTVDLFVLALRAGLLTVEEADAAKVILESKRFTMPFASFRELVK